MNKNQKPYLKNTKKKKKIEKKKHIIKAQIKNPNPKTFWTRSEREMERTQAKETKQRETFRFYLFLPTQVSLWFLRGVVSLPTKGLYWLGATCRLAIGLVSNFFFPILPSAWSLISVLTIQGDRWQLVKYVRMTGQWELKEEGVCV